MRTIHGTSINNCVSFANLRFGNESEWTKPNFATSSRGGFEFFHMAQDVPVAEAQNGTDWQQNHGDLAQNGGVLGENVNEPTTSGLTYL